LSPPRVFGGPPRKVETYNKLGYVDKRPIKEPGEILKRGEKNNNGSPKRGTQRCANLNAGL